MKNLFTKAMLCVSTLLALSSLAYNPPTDTQSGLTLKIEGVSETEPAGKPLSFEVQLSNNSSSNVQGSINIWMNDDWDVTPNETEPLSLDAGQSHTVKCTATAKERVLAAMYPVHASFAAPGDALLHPIALFQATKESDVKAFEVTTVDLKEGILRLNLNPNRRSFYEQNGKVTELSPNFNGSDARSGASISTQNITRNEISRSCFSVHPPYRDGAGTTWNDFPLSLPAEKSASLTFHTSIRDSNPSEGNGSDGVEFKVFVIGCDSKTEQVFSRFSAAKVWEKAAIDLNEYAGQTITLRLWTGPGPKNNTSCDNGYWGDPAIMVGDTSASAPTADQWAVREKLALASAKQALRDGNRKSRGRFVLDVRGEKFGAAVIPGDQGLTDGVIAFTDGTRTLVYRGFLCDIDKNPVGAVDMGMPVVQMDYSCFFGKLYMTHHVSTQAGIVEVRATVYIDDGALRIAWDMPDAVRDTRGTPRFTRLGIGPGSEKLKRAYAGFGNVIEEPESFALRGGGFTLSTRHVGADYANGLSLLQASDTFPDRAVYEKDNARFTLESPHDTSFFFIPSAKGAFAAARAYRDVCGFKRSPGFKNTVGKMCIDQWGGDYAEAAEGIDRAGKYGLNDSIFVKHVWQRWGYDYRLPEIYPPAGSNDDFMRMRHSCKDAGIVFAPHDNYIDFYPDAAGYSYDHILFNADGTPQKAWFNKGRQALSYRWLPHAFQPWMEDNMRTMRDAFQPDGLFIDVFTAIPPLDYYDREGVYYTRNLTAELWGEAFNTCRRILKRGSSMISEAGTDALIGDIDAGQADHFAASRWMKDFGEAVRTPWHDMASHGSMVLLAGGLGSRYSAVDWEKINRPEHGYASDDYLSNTVIGGRNPMCDGPFSRRTVMTYWLLHDLCNELARQEMETHAFGASILQQHTTFGRSGKVWSNRGDEEWKVADNQTLPQYGFYAESGNTRAGIVRLDGQRAAFAQSKTAIFVDARPLFDSGTKAKLSAEVISGNYLGNGKFSFTVKWEVFDSIPESYRPFLHFDTADNDLDSEENIAFQYSLNLPKDKLAQTGTFETTTTFTVPQEITAGDYAIRFGMYNPGGRLKIAGSTTASQRIKGGIISLKKEGAEIASGSYRSEEKDEINKLLEYNTEGRVLDFGSIQTEGAFRLLHRSSRTWTLIPLPGSRPFSASIDLAKLGAKAGSVKNVTAIEPDDDLGKEVEWSQDGGTLKLKLNAHAFGYEIAF